jgi:hypothetical protein
VIRVYPVKWRDFAVKDATWDGEKILKHPSLELLEDKQYQEGRTVISPST